ncbi:helix-turn-helix transcriptional regulator [Achromobacter xylosoxidans]|jgi:putative transcriptional regulator|nr:helix-turn-helix transcriptional regulator [Achromobacter xylosoxidans]MDF3939608.1 helix-turn-helix transcriptional regulator [Achromobacter denitrificans]QQE57443.1 helix-turn-helix transcriptional regulator [Achromobacter xylosoxidans]QQV17082.1 helix-turn-helix transcriptional regulator [Achromobacter xylosoxidans]
MNSIRRIRKAAGLSQAQLAATLKVSQSAISQYERGAIQPGIKQAKRLVALAADSGLSVSLDQVYELPEASRAPPTQESAHA